MKRLIEKTVFSGFVTACRLAGAPTRRSPPSVNATTEGVVRAPSAFSITVGSPPSRTAMHELVVLRRRLRRELVGRGLVPFLHARLRPAGGQPLQPTRTASDGTFSSTGEAVGRYGKDDVGTITETISGKVRRDTAVGTYSATLVLRNAATGATSATCQKRTRRWGEGEDPVGRLVRAVPERRRVRDRRGADQLPDRPQRPLRSRWTDKARRYTVRGGSAARAPRACSGST